MPEKNEVVSVYLPASVKEKIRREAQERGFLSSSEFVRLAIMEKFAALEKIAGGNP